MEHQTHSETAENQEQKLAIVSTAVARHEVSQLLLVYFQKCELDVLQVNLYSLKHAEKPPLQMIW